MPAGFVGGWSDAADERLAEEITKTGSPVEVALRAASVAAAQEAGTFVSPLSAAAPELPAGLLWDLINYGFTFTLVTLADGRCVAVTSKRPRDFFDDASTARTAPQATYYVNSATGNDANPGTSSGSPFQSIYAAIVAANAGGVPATIFVAAGNYSRLLRPSQTNVSPAVDMAIVATGGRVVTGTWDDKSWAADATHTRTYKATTSTADCTGVVWLDQRTADGHYVEATKVDTPALCDATPGSWCISGTDLYVRRPDGSAATSTNTRIYRSVSDVMRLVGATSANVFIGGADERSGFDFEGGTNAALNANLSADPGAAKVLAVENCTFRYSRVVGGTTGRGVSVISWRGLAVFDDCDASANDTDGFNAHNVVSAARSCFLLTVNCTGINNGRMPNTSCNGWSGGHEDMVAIDLGGRYERGRGGTVRNIGTSKVFLGGTYVADDLGDRFHGGIQPPTGIQADDQCETWAYRTNVRMPAGRGAYVATSNAKIHKRETWPTGRRDYAQASALIDAY